MWRTLCFGHDGWCNEGVLVDFIACFAIVGEIPGLGWNVTCGIEKDVYKIERCFLVVRIEFLWLSIMHLFHQLSQSELSNIVLLLETPRSGVLLFSRSIATRKPPAVRCVG